MKPVRNLVLEGRKVQETFQKSLNESDRHLTESGVQTSNDFEAKIEHELDTIRRTVGLILSKSGSVASDKHKLRQLESDVKRRFTDVEKLLDAHRDQVMELFRDALRAIDA